MTLMHILKTAILTIDVLKFERGVAPLFDAQRAMLLFLNLDGLHSIGSSNEDRRDRARNHRGGPICGEAMLVQANEKQSVSVSVLDFACRSDAQCSVHQAIPTGGLSLGVLVLAESSREQHIIVHVITEVMG